MDPWSAAYELYRGAKNCESKEIVFIMDDDIRVVGFFKKRFIYLLVCSAASNKQMVQYSQESSQKEPKLNK